jgi:hypothetical protein
VQAHEEQYHPRRRRVTFSLPKDDDDSMLLKTSARRLARTKSDAFCRPAVGHFS